MQTLLIATKNQGKIKEINEIFKNTPIHLLSLQEIGFNRKISETGKTFQENAVLKAKTVGDGMKIVTLAEDSGLEINALNGQPGVFSARYVPGSDADRVDEVLKQLSETPKEKRSARFVTVVAVYNPKNKKVVTFEGINEGFITNKPIGIHGFGYDPIFFNPELNKTNAQASLEEKNRVSHRARALEKFKAWFRTNEYWFQP